MTAPKAKRVTADGGAAGGEVTDPNTEPEARPFAEAFDPDADERGDQSYTEAPGTGVTDGEGNPVALASSSTEG